MAEGQITEAAVQGALAEFQDPETGRSITQLEQVHSLVIEGRHVSVILGLTSYAAPVWEEIREELARHLKARLPEGAEVEVRVVLHNRPAEKMGEVGLTTKSVIAIGSGKGGVGKSTIAAILAYGLSRAGCKVGLLDADVYGPSIPHLLGVSQTPQIANNRIQPVMVDGMPVMSMGFLVPPGEAVIWRGPMLHSAISQFLKDTEWGELDYLIIDMPPGTGDVPLSLSQLLPVSEAVVVCTPQDVALQDAAKAIAMLRKVEIEVLGVVENMSQFICPNCGARHEIFGSGGARRMAEQLFVPFLGEVPLNVQLRVRGDAGTLGASFEDEKTRPYLESLASNLVRTLVRRNRQSPRMPSLRVLGR